MIFSDKIVILDRDGVINFDSDDYIKSPDEWSPIPGSLEAIAKLCDKGCKVVIASNQSGVGRGLLTLDVLEDIHAKMNQALEKAGGKIDKIYYCPHEPNDNCQCRKPKPGMLLQIAKDFNLDFRKDKNIAFVGDSLRDLQAAQIAGCLGVFVETGNKSLANVPYRYKSLQDFVDANYS